MIKIIIKTIPKKGYIGKQAAIVVKYGGADHIHKLPDGTKVEMPTGIAHFLEHKMFDDPLTNMFDEFTKNGASVNAYTHFTHTVYYFNTTDNFKKNLELLFKLVSTPHFTDENVEKEKGIILSEIDMYADNPYWQVYRGLHQALFVDSPFKQDILGTKESVQSITKEQLYNCYNHFYTTDNMSLVCVGDFKEDEIQDWAGLLKQKPSGVQPYHAKEAQHAAKPIIKKTMNVATPLFQLGFKVIYNKPADPITMVASSILSDMLAGESSSVYAQLYDSGMIDSQFTAEYTGGKHSGIILFSGESTDPEAVCDSILKAKTKVLDTNRFNIIKSKHMGRFLQSLNSIDSISAIQTDLFTKGQDIDDITKAFNNVQMEDVELQLQNCLKEDNFSLSIINPQGA